MCRVEGMPTDPAERPVYYGWELVSPGEAKRRQMWEEVAQACWAFEIADRYYSYCQDMEEKAREEWKVC